MTIQTLHPKTLSFLETKPLPMFVNGEWKSTKHTLSVENPATGSQIAQVCLADAQDVDSAVMVAESAFAPWAALSPAKRADKLTKLAELIQRDAQVLADLECVDVGKPVAAAMGFDVPFAAQCFEYFAQVAQETEYEIELGLEVTDSQTIKRPYGVAAFVFPWNFPLTLCAWGIAPALAAGNTVVIKPASETPLSTLYLAKLCEEAGFPRGVVNVVTGQGRVAGEALINHPKIKLMSFTGSTEVGKHIGEVCGRNLVPAKLELGGKGAAVVCRDADVDAAVEGLTGALTLNAGQVCCTASRWYVHDSIYDEFVAKAKQAFEAIPIGNGLDSESVMGPMCTHRQMSKVLQCIAEAQAAGAEIVTGGDRVTDDERLKGYFVQPTLLAGKDDNPWAQEEIFGPVAFLLKFTDEDEVVERANRNPYGLANSVWTQDMVKAKDIAARLVSGNSWINAHNVFEYGLHYGACNQSGCGGGVNSRATFEGYLRHQSVAAIR
ncbi:aldehyde dehydrogenase family protein [Vibrio astriarenae]|uniref:Aldehyde dehydrogenase family protein n=1 Tax=Vibrio astriarenae TaxID=1481923 RepID=A0A7Z2YDD1_9VIBR|nr:aldehyde dehydrogenase family protein [Vibrio astriarenae]QIA63256.1 aldehyde dehydrogenase family protein [Vibrio astriarenae]